jgi:hypothetical protein
VSADRLRDLSAARVKKDQVVAKYHGAPIENALVSKEIDVEESLPSSTSSTMRQLAATSGLTRIR